MSLNVVLERAFKMPCIGPLVALIYGGPYNVIYRDPAGNPFSIPCTEGVAQGEYNAGLLFNLCIAPIIREVESKYPTCKIPSYHDDVYILGPAADAFEAAKLYAQLLKDHLNLFIQPTKSFVYCPSPSPADAALIASHCASTGVVSLPPADGIVVAGAPVGTEAFERSFTAKYFSNIMAKAKLLPNVASLIADAKVGNLTKQLFMLCRLCIASKATFILRCVPPSRTYDTCRKFDLDFFQQLQLSFPELKGGAALEQRNCSSDRTMLPLRLGGVGVPCTSDAAHAAYLGSLFLAGHRIASLHAVADAAAFDALLPDVVELDATVAFFTALGAFNDQKPIWHKFFQPYASANGPDGDEHAPDKAKDYEGPPATAFEKATSARRVPRPDNALHWQAYLTSLVTAPKAQRILDQLPSFKEKAQFLSFTSPFSYMSMIAKPTFDSACLTGSDVLIWLGLRAGLPPARVAHKCTRNKQAVTTATSLEHSMGLCGWDGRRLHSRRHYDIRDITTDWLSKILGHQNVQGERRRDHDHSFGDRATLVSNLPTFTKKQGILPTSFAPCFADLFVTLAGVGFAADVVVSHPTDTGRIVNSSDRAPMATTRGHYADTLSKIKHAKYSASYDFEPRFLQPLAFDSYGCPSRDTSTFLALVLKHAAVRDPTSKKHEMLADYTARVSTSIIRNTAHMVRSYRQRCAGA